MISFSWKRSASRWPVGAVGRTWPVGRTGRGAGNPLLTLFVILTPMTKHMKRAWRVSWVREGIFMVLYVVTAGALAIVMVSSLR